MGVYSNRQNKKDDDNQNNSVGIFAKRAREGKVQVTPEETPKQLEKPNILDETFNTMVLNPIQNDIKTNKYVPIEDRPDTVTSAAPQLTEEQRKYAETERTLTSNPNTSSALSALVGIQKGQTWGTYSSVSTPEQKLLSDISIEQHPYLNMAGELLGFATSPFTKVAGATGGAFGSLFGKTASSIAPKVSPFIENPVVQSAAKAGTEMAGYSGTSTASDLYREGGMQNVVNNAGTIAESMATGGAFGAILGGGFSGLGKGISNINKALGSSIDETISGFQPNLESFDAFNLKSPIITTGKDMPLKYQNLPKPESPLLLPEGRTFPPPQVPEQYRVETAGNPTPRIELPGDTSMLSPSIESNLKGANLSGGIKPPSGENNPVTSLLNANNIEQSPKPRYSPEIQRQIDDIDKQIKDYREHQNYLVQNGIKLREDANKNIKGNAMMLSAKKREIIQGDSLIPVDGGLTSKELFKKIADLKTNYKGKEVITPDGEGKIKSTVYGKVQVEYANGETRTYTKDKIRPKVNVDEVIAKQKRIADSKANLPGDTSMLQFKTEPIKSPSTVENMKPVLTPRVEPTKTTRRVEEPMQVTSVPKVESSKTEFPTPKPIPVQTIPEVIPEGKIETKTSQFRSNTIERTTDLSPASKTAMPKDLFDYEVESSKDWQSKAVENVRRNPDKVVENIKNADSISGGVQAHEAAVISKELESEAVKTGSVTKLLDWVKTVASKTRESARALKGTDTAWQKEPTPSKAILQAERVVNNAEEEFAKKNPKKYEQYKEDLKSVKGAIKETANKVSDELTYSIVNGLKILDNINLQLFAKGKDKMAQYVKKYYTSDPLERMNIVNKLVKEFGLTKGQAKDFEMYLKKAFDKHFEKTSEQYLKRLMNAKGKQNVTLEKVLKLIKAGAYEGIPDDAQISSILKKKYGMPSLTSNEAKFILTKMRALQRMKPDSDAYRITLGKVQQLISDKQPATFRQKFRGLQRVAFLSNPKTLVTRNPLGNVILGTAENIKDMPGAVIDVITSKIRGSERTTLGNPIIMAQKLGWQSQGLKKGFRDWLLDIKHGVDTSPTRGQLELPSGRTFDNKFLNSIDQFVRKSLQVGDRPFYEAAYKSRINELMKIKKVNVPTDEIKAEARLFALDRVFQGDSVLAKKANELRNAMGVFGDILFPFTQTPANVLDKLLDYTGAGLIKGLVQIGKSSIKGEPFDQKLFVDRLARTFTGVGIITLGYALASLDVIEGGPDKNADVNNFNKQIGKTPYSIKLGDYTLTFDWAQPISGLLAMGADAYKAGKDKADFLGKITAGGAAGINTMLKQSFFQSVLNFLSGYSPAVSIGNTLANSATGLASPTGIKQIAKVIDPIERETYSPSITQEYINKIVKGIPFLSKTLPEKKDTFGKTIQKESNDSVGGFAKNIFDTMFNPGNLSEYKPNELQKELMRVYDKTGKAGIFPNVAEKSIKVNGEKYPLSPEQYVKYQTVMGKYVEDVMQQVTTKNSYKNPKITDEQRSQALAKVVQDSKEYADDIIAKDMGLKDKKVKRKPNPIKVPDNMKKR